MSDHHNEEDHSGPIKTPKQFLLTVVLSFVLPVFIIIGLAVFISSGHKPQAGADSSPEAIEARIQKVGVVEIRAGNPDPRTGEEVYKAQCSTCHGSGALGSPKFKDAGAWGPRIAKGYDALLVSALKGKGNMGPQGGGEFQDYEIGRGLAYMANAAGAKFAMPEVPKAAASAAAK
jgi:cytochrome c5